MSITNRRRALREKIARADADLDARIGHVSADEAQELFQRYHDRAVLGRSSEWGKPLMSIPADPKRDADLRLSAFIRRAGAALESLAKLRSQLELAKHWGAELVELEGERNEATHEAATRTGELAAWRSWAARVLGYRVDDGRARKRIADIRAQLTSGQNVCETLARERNEDRAEVETRKHGMAMALDACEEAQAQRDDLRAKLERAEGRNEESREAWEFVEDETARGREMYRSWAIMALREVPSKRTRVRLAADLEARWAGALSGLDARERERLLGAEGRVEPDYKTITIGDVGCEDCSLFDSDVAMCMAEGEVPRVNVELERPDWCPLERGPVLVTLRRSR